MMVFLSGREFDQFVAHVPMHGTGEMCMVVYGDLVAFQSEGVAYQALFLGLETVSREQAVLVGSPDDCEVAWIELLDVNKGHRMHVPKSSLRALPK